jgi:hypothetical protein
MVQFFCFELGIEFARAEGIESIATDAMLLLMKSRRFIVGLWNLCGYV